MTETIKVGIIPAPERASDIIEVLADELPDSFTKQIDAAIHWEVESITDSLTGAAESVHDILYNATEIKQKNNWDYAICVTDLPIFFQKDVVAADISFEYRVGQISIPSFGWPPMKKRIKQTIIHLLKEMVGTIESNDTSVNHVKTNEKRPFQQNTRILKRTFPITPIRRQENPDDSISYDKHTATTKNKSDTNSSKEKDNEATDTNIDVRYMVYPKINGLLRLVLGMTFANNPMKIMSSFKSIIAVAFTTGAFALIFPTIWKLSQIFSVYRLTALMFFAIFGLVTWIIIVHNLWEYPSKRNEPNLRRLYNLATTSTLAIDVVTYYIMMFLLFFSATLIFIPPEYFESMIEDVGDDSLPTIVHYIRVAWAEASISIVVSAMGAGLENEELVRNITYGYRQSKRYEKMHHHENS